MYHLKNIRGVYALSGMAVVVTEDIMTPMNDGVSKAVFDDIMDSFLAGDYYSVYAFDAKGAQIGSIHGLAGYGTPKKAATEAVKYYF